MITFRLVFTIAVVCTLFAVSTRAEAEPGGKSGMKIGERKGNADGPRGIDRARERANERAFERGRLGRDDPHDKHPSPSPSARHHEHGHGKHSSPSASVHDHEHGHGKHPSPSASAHDHGHGHGKHPSPGASGSAHPHDPYGGVVPPPHPSPPPREGHAPRQGGPEGSNEGVALGRGNRDIQTAEETQATGFFGRVRRFLGLERRAQRRSETATSKQNADEHGPAGNGE